MKIYKRDCSKAEWKEFIEAFNSGRSVEIDEGMFMYWLEILPPVYMFEEVEIEGKNRLCSFGFAEGREHIKDFWKENGKYFCKRSERSNSNEGGGVSKRYASTFLLKRR